MWIWCSIIIFDAILGSFLTSWQLFLSDSIAIDNALQSAAHYGVRKLIPISKPHSPSRLSFFVSLSNRGNAENIPQKSNNLKNVPGNCDDVLRFKSVLLATATCGLVLHPISTYYPSLSPAHTHAHTAHTHTTSHLQPTGPNTPCLDDCATNTHRTLRTPHTAHTTHTPHKPSSLLEVSARRKAVAVLECMVQGLDLSKWFLSSSSSATSQSRSSAGSKVKYLLENQTRGKEGVMSWRMFIILC